MTCTNFSSVPIPSPSRLFLPPRPTLSHAAPPYPHPIPRHGPPCHIPCRARRESADPVLLARPSPCSLKASTRSPAVSSSIPPAPPSPSLSLAPAHRDLSSAAAGRSLRHHFLRRRQGYSDASVFTNSITRPRATSCAPCLHQILTGTLVPPLDGPRRRSSTSLSTFPWRHVTKTVSLVFALPPSLRWCPRRQPTPRRSPATIGL